MPHLTYTPRRHPDRCMVCGKVVNEPGDCADCESEAKAEREAERDAHPHPQYRDDGKGNMVLVELPVPCVYCSEPATLATCQLRPNGQRTKPVHTCQACFPRLLNQPELKLDWQDIAKQYQAV